MTNFFRHAISAATLAQLVVELVWLVGAAALAIRFASSAESSFVAIALPALVFAVLILSLNGAFGLYRSSTSEVNKTYMLRLILAPLIGVPLAYVIAEVLPGGRLLQDSVGYMLLAIGSLLLLRHTIVIPLLAALLPHRVLVLGTGPEARQVEASLAAQSPTGFQLVGFYRLDGVTEQAVAPSQVIPGGRSLDEAVRQLDVDEIIVAVRQQRGGVLPLRALLDCRIAGVKITDLARFFERVHGKVPIDAVKASWLIYGSGYRQSLLRGVVKRSFDILVASLLLALTLPLAVMTAILIALETGRPVFYHQVRVGVRGQPFTVLKFRSMRQDAEVKGNARWAQQNDPRMTRVGRFLRRSRIDELPQLINVLRGDMSFVGPRPERPEFVAMLAEKIPFYAVRHSVKPGLTGWAQVRYAYGASLEEAAGKLEYDLYYVKNHTLSLDLLILLETVRVVLLGEGAR